MLLQWLRRPPQPCPLPREEREKILGPSMGLFPTPRGALFERLGGKPSTRRNLITTNLTGLDKTVFLSSEHSLRLAHWMSPCGIVLVRARSGGA
jgi:hypothetical protein